MNQIIKKIQENPLQLISFIKAEKIAEWYLIPFDYWMMSHWGQYGIKWDLPDEVKELEFLNLVSKFQINAETLKEAKGINKQGLVPEKILRPQIYANFDEKVFYSFFGEYALEGSILKSWKGVYFDFQELIPKENKY